MNPVTTMAFKHYWTIKRTGFKFIEGIISNTLITIYLYKDDMEKNKPKQARCSIVEIRPDLFYKIQNICKKHDLKKRKLVSDLLEEGLKNFTY